jgi:hypothetical protein
MMRRPQAADWSPRLATCIYAQGEIILANVDNTSTDPFATANGLYWLSTGGTPVLIDQDFNAAFYAGADSSSLPLIATFLLSDGTAVHDNTYGPGTFIQTRSNVYRIPGAFLSAFFQIQAWTGNSNSYAAAVSGGAPAAQSPVFVNPLNIPPGAPVDLDKMPAMILSVIPEPSTISLLVMGGVFLFTVRGRRSSKDKEARLQPVSLTLASTGIMKLWLTVALVAGAIVRANAQGQILYDNLLNNSRDPAATSNGLVWTSTGGAPSLIYEDFNIAFYIGLNPDNLPLINAYLLSNGTAKGDCWDYGQFSLVNPPGYTLPVFAVSAFVQIQAWTGNFSSYSEAASGGALVAQTPVFSNLLGIPPGPAIDMISMPAMVLSVVPEPSAVALLFLGGISFYMLKRRPVRRR